MESASVYWRVLSQFIWHHECGPLSWWRTRWQLVQESILTSFNSCCRRRNTEKIEHVLDERALSLLALFGKLEDVIPMSCQATLCLFKNKHFTFSHSYYLAFFDQFKHFNGMSMCCDLFANLQFYQNSLFTKCIQQIYGMLVLVVTLYPSMWIFPAYT